VRITTCKPIKSRGFAPVFFAVAAPRGEQQMCSEKIEQNIHIFTGISVEKRLEAPVGSLV
jgi:hypothetical protein